MQPGEMMSISNSLEIASRALRGKKAYCLINTFTNEKYEVNSSEIFRAASLIKLPILWAYLTEVSAGNINSGEYCEINTNLKVGGTGILKNLASTAELTYEELATYMITESDNIATNILVDLLGFNLINSKINDLGMPSTCLQRKMQDFESASQGKENVTTASDIAIFLLKIVNGVNANDSVSILVYQILKGQKLNSKLPKLLPANIEVAHKTGDLPQLEHDAGILSLNEKKMVVVAMTDELVDNSEGALYCQTVGKIAGDWLLA